MNKISKEKAIKIAVFCSKFVLANIIAIMTTSFVIYFYYNKSSSQGTLNGRPFPHLKPYSHCRLAYEGYCSGTFDFNGFNNLYCVENNIQVLAPECASKEVQIDSLLFGSSEMYGVHVPMNKLCSYLINKKYDSDERFLLYNIGISGHAVVHIANMYEEALDYFQPKRYAIIETRRLPLCSELKTFETAEKVLLNRIESKLAIFVSEHMCSLRWMILNIQEGLEGRRLNALSSGGDNELWNEENVVYLRDFLSQFSEASQVRGVRPILFYHPRFTLNTDGSASFDFDSKVVDLWRTECEKQGIVFLYLGDRFMREYEEKGVIPYGFWNTLPNTGHLNKDGHRMIADELCKVIEQLEEERKENVQ